MGPVGRIGQLQSITAGLGFTGTVGQLQSIAGPMGPVGRINQTQVMGALGWVGNWTFQLQSITGTLYPVARMGQLQSITGTLARAANVDQKQSVTGSLARLYPLDQKQTMTGLVAGFMPGDGVINQKQTIMLQSGPYNGTTDIAGPYVGFGSSMIGKAFAGQVISGPGLAVGTVVTSVTNSLVFVSPAPTAYASGNYYFSG